MARRVVITPHEAFGPIVFGMSTAQVEEAVGRPDVILPGWNPELHPSYHYKRLGNVGFSAEGRCFWVGSFPRHVEAVVDGLPLVGRFDEIVGSLTEAGHELLEGDIELGEYGFTYCPSLGIMIGRENPESGPHKVDTVAAWGPGYWESQPGPSPHERAMRRH